MINLNKLDQKTILVGTLFIFFVGAVLAVAIPAEINRRKDVSVQRSRANVGGAVCDVSFSIAGPTLTPTETPTVTPTPPLVCSNLDIAVVIDRSSTMEGEKLALAKQAAAKLIETIKDANPSGVRVAVVSFGVQGDDNTGINLPYSKYNSTVDLSLTDNFDVGMSAVNNIQYKASGTCVQCGIRMANRELTRDMGTVENRLVEIVLSDGLANKRWNGSGSPWSSTSNPMTSAIDEANLGRGMKIEYRVVGFGSRNLPYPTPQASISEPTLKALACQEPSDLSCVDANYTYQPDPTQWSNTFVQILNDLCR